LSPSRRSFGLLLGLSSITIPWETLFCQSSSTRRAGDRVTSLAAILAGAGLAATLRRLQPASLVALLATLVLLFGFQGDQIVRSRS